MPIGVITGCGERISHKFSDKSNLIFNCFNLELKLGGDTITGWATFLNGSYLVIFFI
jgi:hypothetical protein